MHGNCWMGKRTNGKPWMVRMSHDKPWIETTRNDLWMELEKTAYGKLWMEPALCRLGLEHTAMKHFWAGK